MERSIQFSGMALGRHAMLEYYDCDTRTLADCARMRELFIAAAKASGATVLNAEFHDFSPQGVSGVVVISESHFAVHAWPEHDYAAVDVFTCGDRIDFDRAAAELKRALKAGTVVVSGIMNRGIVGVNGLERAVPTVQTAAEETAVPLHWRERFESVQPWGLQAAIDLFDCAPDRLTPERMRTFLPQLAGELQMHPEGACHRQKFRHPVTGDGMRFTQQLAEGVLIGHLAPERRRVFLDCFSSNYFEPRSTAERALKEFGGVFYRLQIAVRQ